MASLQRFVNRDRPLVFAHRGGSVLAPENTLAAFDRGLAEGADGLELDVRLSRDGRPVVHHDERLERTTNGRGLVTAASVEELARLDAGCRFRGDGDFPFLARGFSVPTLADVLGRYPDVPIIIEMKHATKALAEATLEDVRRATALDRVCFAGADRLGQRVVRARDPDATTSASALDIRWALYRSWMGWPLGRRAFQLFQVPEKAGRVRVVSPRFVRAAHAAGLPVQVWTVDREQDMRRLLSWGIDGIITDRPDVAASVVRERTRDSASEGRIG